MSGPNRVTVGRETLCAHCVWGRVIETCSTLNPARLAEWQQENPGQEHPGPPEIGWINAYCTNPVFRGGPLNGARDMCAESYVVKCEEYMARNVNP